jgi:hypothetical protein
MERNADTFVPTGMFWRAWPYFAGMDDFKTKAEAKRYCERNGGGGIQKMRYSRRGTSTVSSMDTIEIPAKV